MTFTLPSAVTHSVTHSVTPPAATPATPTPHSYVCSECLDPTPAVEVHRTPAGWAAYCQDCALTWRGWARTVLPADVAAAGGVEVTV